MPKIVITDAKMQMLHSVWNEIIALGEIVVTERDDEETLIREVAETDLIISCYAKITGEIIRSGKKLKAILNNDTLVNVKNGDILESMGKIINRLPYGELPYSLDE